MKRAFCNIPALSGTLAYSFRNEDDAVALLEAVTDRVSGIRLPPYEFAAHPSFEVFGELEIDAAVSGDRVSVEFRGEIPSHRYEAELESFHWDFWKISIAALSKGLLARGVVILHAACVAAPETVFLLPGTSGAGKSSLSFFARSRGASVYASELAFISEARLIAGNALMSIDEEALRLMNIPHPSGAISAEGKLTLATDPIPAAVPDLSLVFPRISPAPTYFERVISARRSRMLLFENAVGQLGVSQLIDQQRVPVRSLPTHAEIEAIMRAVSRIASRESLICEGPPDKVWTRLVGG